MEGDDDSGLVVPVQVPAAERLLCCKGSFPQPGADDESPRRKFRAVGDGSNVAVSEEDFAGDPKKSVCLLYGLDDLPPALVLLLLSLQHCLVQLLPCLLAAHAIAPALCLPADHPARAELLCRLLLLAALATLLNNTSFGLRLGLVHGPCVASLAAVLLTATGNGAGTGNGLNGNDSSPPPPCPSGADQFAMGPQRLEAVWQPRVQRLQATLLVVTASSACLAAAGLPRLIAKFVSPLSSAVATMLSVLPVAGYAIHSASANWVGALSCALAVLGVGVALRRVQLPVLVCSVRRGHMHARLLPALSMLAVLVPLLAGWAVCAVLTATGLLHGDISLSISTSEWRTDRIFSGALFAIPWPAPYGWPSLRGLPWMTVASAVSAGLVVSVTAQLTTFSAAGAVTGSVPDGPRMQRGLLMNSVVGFLGALWGAPCAAGGGQETPGVVALTQAGPVSCARLAGVLLLLASLSPCFASALTVIPLPLQAGAGLTLLAAGAGQGIKYLREVDLKSVRNCVIFGLSLLTGVSVAGRLGFPAIAPDSRLESVDAVAAAAVAASPLAGAALSMVLDTVLVLALPQPQAQAPRAPCNPV